MNEKRANDQSATITAVGATEITITAQQLVTMRDGPATLTRSATGSLQSKAAKSVGI